MAPCWHLHHHNQPQDMTWHALLLQPHQHSPLSQCTSGLHCLTALCGAGEEATIPQGGLPTLMAMVMGGLVATTPHMVSACVMALARLLFEFAGLLEQAAPRLLETVLMLLRSKSREVIKSVIGFCKVGWRVPQRGSRVYRVAVSL